jgi:hypothetical protein
MAKNFTPDDELRDRIASIFDAYRIENNERGLGMLDIEPSVDLLMQLFEAECRRREAEAVVRELEDVYDWRQLYALNGGSVSVFVVHANRIKDRIIKLKATISGKERE